MKAIALMHLRKRADDNDILLIVNIDALMKSAGAAYAPRHDMSMGAPHVMHSSVGRDTRKAMPHDGCGVHVILCAP